MNINNDEMKIKIGAETQEFEQKINKMGQLFGKMTQVGSATFEKIGEAGGNTFVKIGNTFDNASEKMSKKMKETFGKIDTSFKKTEKNSEKTFDEMKRDFSKYADKFKQELADMEKENKDTNLHMVQSQVKVKEELFKMAEVAKRSGHDIGQVFDEVAAQMPQKMGKSIEKMRKEFQQLEKSSEEAARNAESKWKTAGEKISGVGKKLTAATTAGAAAGIAGGTALAMGANDRKQQKNNLQISLGLDDSDTDKAFGTVNKLYKDGLGENMDEVNKALVTTKQNLQGLSDVDLEKVTKFSLMMDKSFGQDTQETTRTMATLMKQFGINAEDAMDIITYGMQNGLNKNGDYLDSLNEYSSYFKIMGKDAGDMVSMLKKAKDEGVWSMDKAGDLVKEGSLSLRNIGSAEQEGINTIYNLDTSEGSKAKNAKFYKEIQDDINAGGSRAAGRLNEIVEKLGQLSDAKRYTAGVSIFKTQWEDVGSDIAMKMLQVQETVEGIGGSSKKAADKMSDNFTVRLAKISREFKDELQPLGESLLELGEEALPIISKWAGKLAEHIEDLSKWFDGLSDSQKETIVKFGLFVGAAGPAIIIIGKIASSLGVLKNVIGMTSTAGAIGAVGKFGAVLGGLGTTLLPIVGTLATVAGIFAAIEKFAPKSATTEAEKMAEKFKTSMEKIRGEWDKTNESIKNKTLDTVIDAKTGKKANKEQIASLSDDITTKADISVKELKRSKRNEIKRVQDMKDDKDFYSKNRDVVDTAEADSKIITANIDKDIARIRKLEKEAKKSLSEGIGKNGVMSEEAVKDAATSQAKIAEISASYMKDVNKRSLEEMVSHQDEVKKNQEQYIIDSVGKAQAEFDEKKTIADDTYNQSVETARKLYEDLGVIDEDEFKARVQAAEDRRTQMVTEAEETKKAYITALESVVGDVDGIVDTATGKVKTLYTLLTNLNKAVDFSSDKLSSFADISGHVGETVGRYFGLDPKKFDKVAKRDGSKVPSDMNALSDVASSFIHTPLKLAVNLTGEIAPLVNKVSTTLQGKTKKKSSYRTTRLKGG